MRKLAFPSSGEPGGCLGQGAEIEVNADQGAAFADRIQETLTLLRLMYKHAFEKITTIRFQITADSTPLTALQLSERRPEGLRAQGNFRGQSPINSNPMVLEGRESEPLPEAKIGPAQPTSGVPG